MTYFLGIEPGDMNFNKGTYALQEVPPPCSELGHAPCMPRNGSLPERVVVDPRGTILHDINNWGPRLGLAYHLGTKTVIRSSGGMVYDNDVGVNETVQDIQGSWPGVGQELAENLNVPKPGRLRRRYAAMIRSQAATAYFRVPVRSTRCSITMTLLKKPTLCIFCS